LNADPTRRLRHDGEERVVAVAAPPPSPTAALDGSTVHVDVDGQSLAFSLASAPTVEQAVRQATAAAGEGSSVLTAPMPGRVIAVRVTEGATIKAREAVVIIEAMKMEHAVVAAMDGVVARLTVVEGQQVERGEVIGELAHD
jgi:acetyl/propionyl-CoA carboxylase alpha subunit